MSAPASIALMHGRVAQPAFQYLHLRLPGSGKVSREFAARIERNTGGRLLGGCPLRQAPAPLWPVEAE